MRHAVGREPPVTEIGSANDRYAVMVLDSWLNAKGVAAGPGEDAGLNVWGNAFPAAYFPGGDSIEVGGVPFRLATVGPRRYDHVRCDGQLVGLPVDRYDWVHVLGTSERRSEEVCALHFADGAVDTVTLRLSDFWAASPAFGEREALTAPEMVYPRHVQAGVVPVVWAQRVPVQRRAPLRALRLPRTPALHLFALTLSRTPR